MSMQNPYTPTAAKTHFLLSSKAFLGSLVPKELIPNSWHLIESPPGPVPSLQAETEFSLSLSVRSVPEPTSLVVSPLVPKHTLYLGPCCSPPLLHQQQHYRQPSALLFSKQSAQFILCSTLSPKSQLLLCISMEEAPT